MIRATAWAVVICAALYATESANTNDRTESKASLSAASGYAVKKATDDVSTTLLSKLQYRIKTSVAKTKEQTRAKEVLAVIMDAHTGAIVAAASSNPYEPIRHAPQDIPILPSSFTTYAYEPGSVTMPFTAALVLSTNLDDADRIRKCIDTHNGTFRIGKMRIVDKSPAACLTMGEVIRRSSHIGIAKLALTIDGPVFHDALMRYGFGVKTGIDLPGEASGEIKSAEKLDHPLYRATTSYGYGMHATPLQLLKAYAAFANDGYAPMPRFFVTSPERKTKTMTQKTARQIQTVLVDTAKSYPALANVAQDGIRLGGKASSAFIAKHGRYGKHVNASFYGFVQDADGHRYVIGVVVIDPKHPKMRYASRITPPLVAKIVRAMQEEEMLHTAAKKRVPSFTYLSPLAYAKVVEPFGETFDAMYGIKVPHPYIVLKPAATPDTVRSIAPGSVVFAGESSMLGNAVVVKHEGDIYAVYGHLAHIAPSVHKGKKLKAGEILGNVEKALYFQIKKGEKSVDPQEVVGL